MGLLINPYIFDSSILPYRFDLLAWAAPSSVSGFTATRYQSSAEFAGGYLAQQSAAAADSGDYYEIEFTVAAGTWELTIFHQKNPNAPIVEFLIDGISLGTVDMYSAGTSHNNVATFSSIALSEGSHTIKVLANGKNASSGDYNFTVQSMHLTRTGA